MSSNNIHRGEIVEKIVRKSGYSLSKLAKKLTISRNTLYNRFKNPHLKYHFIRKVGETIHYNFTIDFPEMKEELGLTEADVPPLDYGENQSALLWRLETKYSKLLEKYNKLLEIVVSVVDANELHDFRQEIAAIVERGKEKGKGKKGKV